MFLKDVEDDTYYNNLLNSLKHKKFYKYTGLKNNEVNFNKSHVYSDDDFN